MSRVSIGRVSLGVAIGPRPGLPLPFLLTLGGEPLTLGGQYLTLGAPA